MADLLAAGELDVGLIPSIELQRIEGLEVLPGLAVAAEREVRSVLMVSRVPPGEIRKLALDENSRTSAALVRILLEERYGVTPECVAAAPDVEAMLAGADAALVIGDPALHIERGRYLILDLAREWRELTGYPFVFAVWAVRAALPHEAAIQRVFEESLRSARESMEELAASAASELGLPLPVVRTYLTRNLSFTLGQPELAGLREFLGRARQHGLIERVEPLRFRAG